MAIFGNHSWIGEKARHRIPVMPDNFRYIQDESIELFGLKIYGTAWSLPFNNWAFNLPEEELCRKFAHIPNNIDILITHSPPFGILDSTPIKKNLGSKSLLEKVVQVKPQFHIFGHIHHGYGQHTDKDNNITFMNVSLLDEGYNFVNEPMIIEV